MMQKEIAERKKTERWLLESEERFRSYFEQGLVGMAILSPKRDWIEVNGRLSKMLGYQELEIPLASWTEFTHETDRDAEDRYFQQIGEGLVSGYTVDKRFFTQGWENRYCQCLGAIAKRCRRRSQRHSGSRSRYFRPKKG
jgi:PAS domain S-box-containing protein